MTVITKEHIDHHCKTLSISREELIDFTIPDGVKKIGNHAFQACTTLESITIPTGVINIEWNTFDGCTSLTSITILWHHEIGGSFRAMLLSKICHYS